MEAALAEKTDWDKYYEHAFPAATFSRRFTSRLLRKLMVRFCGADGAVQTFLELGGANSCFYDDFCQALSPRTYHVFDLNQKGLDLLRQRRGTDARLQLHRGDVLNPDLDLQADLVLSVGLIEHFDPDGTAKAI